MFLNISTAGDYWYHSDSFVVFAVLDREKMQKEKKEKKEKEVVAKTNSMDN